MFSLKRTRKRIVANSKIESSRKNVSRKKQRNIVPSERKFRKHFNNKYKTRARMTDDLLCVNQFFLYTDILYVISV